MAPKMCFYVGKYLIKAKNVHLLVKKHVGLNLKPKIETKKTKSRIRKKMFLFFVLNLNLHVFFTNK